MLFVDVHYFVWLRFQRIIKLKNSYFPMVGNKIYFDGRKEIYHENSRICLQIDKYLIELLVKGG